MFRWLLQWLNNFFKPLFDSQSPGLTTDGDSEFMDVDSLPQLTDADLEVLFNQLLEGVYQARGQQWALKYLQRMEPRITVDHWLDWLLVFGEKLLSSTVPNYQTATRMVQLGELNVGKVGELAYDIGIQLLRQNLAQEDESEPVQIEEPVPLLDSPGQKLLREFGEQFWASEEEVLASTLNSMEEKVLAGTLNSIEMEADNTQNLLSQDAEDSTTFVEVTISEEMEAQSLLSQDSEDSTTFVEVAISEEQSQDAEDTTTFVEDVEGIISPEVEPPDSLSLIQEQSLSTPEPQVAYTLEELVVRLEESTNLVQQLASALAIRTPTAETVALTKRESLSIADQAQASFYRGLEQTKAGNLLGALACYHQAIELQPKVEEYWFNQGLTLFHLQRLEEAIASYQQAIAIKPKSYKSWDNLGRIWGELGNFEEAIAAFTKVNQIRPDYAAAWSSRGALLLKLGLIWEAIDSYDQALNLEPQDAENWYYRGIALAVCEQYTEAIASYDQSLNLQPNYHEVWIDRGVVLFNLNRWSEAIDSWDQALSIQPDLYLAWFNRGVALDNLGRREEAIASYQQAIGINQDFHLAWYNQAVALFYLARYAEAITAYDHALQIKPDYWEAWIGRGTSAGNLVIADAALRVAGTNVALSGDEGKLASYETGLQYLRADTHPEGWGRLHLAIANTHYEQGKKQPTPTDNWHQAVNEYQQALLTLTSEDFPELHLEILQSLTKVLIGLEQTTLAQEYQQQGTNLLQQLLNQVTLTDENKKQLALKFAGLNQLAVDLSINTGDLIEAWEIAEQGKNSCLSLLLLGWSEGFTSVQYQSVQRLLNPTTAIIYWHISPTCLHTFIIKDQAPSPILLFTPIQDLATIPEGVKRLMEFENWLEDWHQQYQEYHDQSLSQEAQKQHLWRQEMEQKFLQLQNILNISTIIQELEGITKLILVPHRDLHRIPIHLLFNFLSIDVVNSNYTISYLPSIQMGVSITPKLLANWQRQQLLIVDHPQNTSLKPTLFGTEVIGRMFGNLLHIQGKKSTKEQVNKLLLADYNIFHFMGGAINNSTQPSKSELRLLGEDKLTLLEISQKTLTSYNLVTLFNCQIVGNNNIIGEYLGLDTGFMNAGVPYIISTIWKVESSACELLIIEFYRRLHPNQSPVIALNEAIVWLKEITAQELTKWYEELLNGLHPDEFKIKNHLATQMYKTSKMTPEQKPYNHPYYWAAFMVTGCG